MCISISPHCVVFERDDIIKLIKNYAILLVYLPFFKPTVINECDLSVYLLRLTPLRQH